MEPFKINTGDGNSQDRNQSEAVGGGSVENPDVLSFAFGTVTITGSYNR